MRWLWLSAFLTTFFWLHVVPVYTRNPGSWLWLILPAIIASAVGLRRSEVRDVDWRWLVLVFPLAAAFLVVPFPYSVPMVLFSLGLLILSFGRLSPALAWTGLPLGLMGIVLAFQAAAFPLIYIFSSRMHEVPALTPFFYGIVHIFHPRAGLSEHNIVINYVYDVFEFPTRLEALGFMPAALFAVAGVVLLAALGRSVKAVMGFLAILAGYSVLRYIILIFLTVRLKTASVFWLPLPTALSYVPLVLALMSIPWLAKPPKRSEFSARWPGSRRLVPAFALLAAGVVCAVGVFAYHDPGIPKEGRLLIDELHSDWEWTTEEYDTEWYGRRSGYNYYSLAEYLKKHFYVEVRSEPLLRDLLSGYDIVMLKTPTNPFSEEEIEALVDFVRAGGGLWLLGDHTNVFGTSTYLNQLTGRFGLRLRYDSTYDLRSMGLSLFERPAIFPHPVVAFMPPYLFATSCSMESPFFSENMILGYGLKAMELDYGETSFFPDKDSRNYSFGIFVQQGGTRFGKGRVALFTDSTCFSNFFMFIPGKPELALGTLEWLNRTNSRSHMNIILFIVGVILLATASRIMTGWQLQQYIALCVAAAFVGITLAVLVYDAHVRRSYPLPEPHTDMVTVAFESEHSGFTLPTRGLTKFPEFSLHTFYVWTQRLGLFPSYEPTLESALSKGDLVVIARPMKPLEQAEVDALTDHIERGGKLFIIVDSENLTPAALDLLGIFGVGVETAPTRAESKEERKAAEGEIVQQAEESPGDRPYIVAPGGDPIVPAARPVGLTGGEAMLRLSDGRVVLCRAVMGEGEVFVFSDFHLFTVENMGHTGITPDARQRAVAELEYYMLREFLGMPQPPLLWESQDR